MNIFASPNHHWVSLALVGGAIISVCVGSVAWPWFLLAAFILEASR